MSDESTPTVTSPDLPVDSGIVKTQKQFSDSLTQDLTDEEIQKCLRIIIPIKSKWERRFVSRFSHNDHPTEKEIHRFLDEFEDEIKTTLAEQVNVLATVDTTPLLMGEPPEIEFVGALPGHSLHKYGFDHEKKTWEVTKATQLGEDFLGQESM